jgi:hypothetical protein
LLIATFHITILAQGRRDGKSHHPPAKHLRH